MPNHPSTLDLSRFVAIGDSITAGYADGALHYSGQLTTYANLIAKQCRTALFNQPLTNPQSVGIGFSGRSRLVLTSGKNPEGKKFSVLSYEAQNGDLKMFSENIYATQGPFHNMAVPGAKTGHLIYPGYGNPDTGAGNYNPFFTRMASDPVKTSVLADIMALDPTFFTLFIGNNDVLAYAMSGGTTDAITPVKSKAGEDFSETHRYIVEMLTAKGAKGILATLPDLMSIPFFNTIPYNGLSLNKKEAELLTGIYRSDALNFKPGKSNPFVIEDRVQGKAVIRKAESEDLILCEIMSDNQREEYLKGFAPIPKKYTLTRSQALSIEEAVGQYNTAIQALAKEKNLGCVNINHLLKHLKADRAYIPETRSIYYKETGVFSLDGIHINALGQALLANEFIKTIHRTYDLKLSRVPLVKFRKKQ